jgi:hypothetical protein
VVRFSLIYSKLRLIPKSAVKFTAHLVTPKSALPQSAKETNIHARHDVFDNVLQTFCKIILYRLIPLDKRAFNSVLKKEEKKTQFISLSRRKLYNEFV